VSKSTGRNTSTLLATPEGTAKNLVPALLKSPPAIAAQYGMTADESRGCLPVVSSGLWQPRRACPRRDAEGAAGATGELDWREGRQNPPDGCDEDALRVIYHLQHDENRLCSLTDQPWLGGTRGDRLAQLRSSGLLMRLAQKLRGTLAR
jgi:hypothetical protein